MILLLTPPTLQSQGHKLVSHW